MAKSFEYYKGWAESLLDSQAMKDRNAAFEYYRMMFRGEWDLPAGLEKIPYMHKMVDHSPHDAVVAGTRVLSSIFPKVKIYPPQPSPDAKALANERERVLKWHLMAANRRRPKSVVNDVVLSALLYDAVAITIMDLDHQLEQAEALKADTARMKALKRVSKFVVNTYYPGDVYAQRSSYGTEAVLLCQERPASEVVAEWGEMGKKLKEAAEENKTVRYYDYWDYNDRCVWVEPSGASGEEKVILSPAEHGLGFMPWVALMGGSTIESIEADKYHPMLYPLFKTKSWETLCALMTITGSEQIAKAFKKEVAVENAPPEGLDLDYTSPDGILEVPAGARVQQLAKQPADPGKMEVMGQLRLDIERATVSRLLQGGDVPSGTAFAALSLATQTAVGALKPGKELAEKALAEMFTLMLLWTAGGDEPLEARGMDKRSDLGQQLRIVPDEIDVDNIYLEVELTPDEPTDRVQRANAANLLYNMGYPKEYALESVGVEDPQAAMKLHWFERMKEARLQNMIDSERMMMDAQFQQMQAQAQMAQQQEAQMMAQQAQMQGPFQGGQGFNPAMGGIPPAIAFQEGTREEVDGDLAAAMGGMGGL